MEDRVDKWIQGHSQEMVDMACDLIAIPTVNPPGASYQQCADYISDKLKTWHIAHEMITIFKKKHSRFTIIGEMGEGDRGIHFHGHYDVVPPHSEYQFHPVVRNGTIHGRGSSDMKGGLVSMLYAIRFLKTLDIPLGGKVTFSIAPDEETCGAMGAKYLFDEGVLPVPGTLGMLMPEATSGAVWNANRGAFTCKVVIRGKSAHAGLAHQGTNAFENMMTIASDLMEMKKNVQERQTASPVDPPEADRSVMLIGGEAGSGCNFNVVPKEAYFTIDRRFNPEETLEAVRGELMALFDNYMKQGMDISVEVIQEGNASSTDKENRIAHVLSHSIAEISGKKPDFILCPGICEIRFFNNRGIPALAYGPGMLEVSHGPNEHVKIDDIMNCAKIYAMTARRILSDQTEK